MCVCMKGKGKGISQFYVEVQTGISTQYYVADGV